ncbi:MAG TPA: DUF3147 family protein [Candidatus Binataceae bacterium]|nr:DUF3147 family protein [Candidatus Binataceae bacterium]
MLIRFKPAALKETRWSQYAVRFLLGGSITALAGIIAKDAGPVFGGLFLAFPAIFPASATLIESHVREEKQKKGLDGTRRGRQAAGIDAIGAAMGAAGLIAFALWTWRFLPLQSSGLVLLTATLLWAVTSILIWYIRRHIHPFSLR